MLLIEPPHRGGARPPDGGQRGPLGEKVAGLARVEGPDPVEGLGEILLEQARDPVREAASEIDEFPPVLAEQLEGPRRHRIRVPGPELVAMFAQQVQQERGVRRVVFRAAGVEGFAIAGQRLGIDRVEHEELVLHQRVDHRASPLFDGNPHGPAPKPLAELGDPAVQHVRLLLERELFHRAARGGLELHRVRAISPIESDVHRDVLFMLHGPSGSGTHAWLRPAQALS